MSVSILHDGLEQEVAVEVGVESDIRERLTSKNAHVTFGQDSCSQTDAQRILQETVRVLDSLTTLIQPDPSLESAQVHICLVSSLDEISDELEADIVSQFGPLISSTIYRETSAGLPPVLPVDEIVHLWLNYYYGDAARRSALLSEGLSGYIAATALLGPSIAESDRRVHEELENGHYLSIFALAPSKSPSKLSGSYGSAAWTSFIAFIINNNGPSAFRHYCEVLNTAQPDSAAMAAFTQPLAVLEEAWLAALRRKSGRKDDLRSLMKRLLPLLREFKWRQGEVVLLTMAAAAYNLVWPISTQRFIHMVAGYLKSYSDSSRAPMEASGRLFFLHQVAPFLCVLLVLYIVDALVTMRRTYAASRINVQLLNRLRERMYNHILSLSHDFYTNSKCADLMTRLTDDVQNVQQALQQVTNKSLYQIFTLAGGVIALIVMNRSRWQITTSVLLIVPLFAFIYATLRARNKAASREQRKRVSQTASATLESLLAHSTVKAFNLQLSMFEAYRHRLELQGQSALNLAMLGALSDLSEDMVTALAQLVIFGVGGYMLVVVPSPGPDHGLGELAAALLLVKVIFGPIASLSGVGQTIQQAAGAIERVNDLFDETVAVSDKEGAIDLPRPEKQIRFENVRFGYGSPRATLRGLSMTIPAGANVAIVGATGSGKSTIINLLMRFWDPSSGRILFDGIDLRDATIESLRRQIGMVFQDTFIFDTTVMENIRIGKADATDLEVIAAAKAARVHDDISDPNKFPAGYETVLGEGGGRLSGGQRQRIGIARAILRNPPILLFDEASSALDAKTEADVLETVREISKSGTTISVTHRLSWASTADLILVIENGRLAEQGSHGDLIDAGGIYCKLYHEQINYATSLFHSPASAWKGVSFE